MIIPTVFGQLTNDSIVVETDKLIYSDGDTIMIFGEVRDLYSGTPVSVIVKSPIDELVLIAQVEVSDNKTFSTEITAGGSLMNINGTYTVTAQYGTVNRSASTTFDFQTDSSQVCGPGTIYDSQSNSCILTFDDNPLTLQTDKQYYSHGELIIVTGNVKNITNSVISLVVKSPLKSVVIIDQLDTDEFGNFQTTLDTIDNMWKYDGSYTISIIYGEPEKTNQIKISLTGGVEYIPSYPTPPPEQQQLTLKQTQLNTINHQINSFETKLTNIQTTIDSQQVRLDKATLNNSTQRIDKLTTNIESMTALQNIYELLITLAQNQIILYS